MKQITANIILISLWTSVVLVHIMSASDITWTKYIFEDESNGLPCSSTEYLFVRDDVPDFFACGRIGYQHKECLTTVFRPMDLQCIGCSVLDYQALLRPEGSIMFTRRDYHIDCKDVLAKDKFAKSGVYEIRLQNSEAIDVVCDMETDGGGWTVFQKRFDDIIDFDKGFADYENGFGDLNSDFWLGLKFVQELTVQDSDFRFAYDTRGGQTGYEEYTRFKILGEKYVLSMEKKEFGETGKNRFLRFNSSEFSTYDQGPMGNCADNSGGGWWYDGNDVVQNCFTEHLNSDNWVEFYIIGSTLPDPLRRSTMMVRRH